MAAQILINASNSIGSGDFLDCRNGNKACFLMSGHFNGTVSFQATIDGTNWFPFKGSLNGNCNLTSSETDGNTAYVEFDVEHILGLRPSIKSIYSGSITVIGYIEPRRSAAASYLHINATTTGTAIKTSVGQLEKIIVNDPGTDMEIELYDSTSAASNPIAKIKCGANVNQYDFSINFSNGLYMVVTGTPGDFTVVYN